MRRLAFSALFLGVLSAPALIAQSSRTPALEARSTHHALTIEFVQVSGDTVEYAATVRDLDQDRVILTRHLTGRRGESAETMTNVDGVDVRIKVASVGGRYSASMEMRRGDAVVDFVSSATAAVREPRELPPGVFRVGGEVKAPTVISRAEPMYSEDARKARVSGIVILECVIDSTGAVRDVIVLKDLPYGLGEAATTAVKQWRFKPGTIEGKPVDVVFNLTVNFRLDKSVPPPPPQ
jgi:TonB family protein